MKTSVIAGAALVLIGCGLACQERSLAQTQSTKPAAAKEDIDRLAACVILESWFEARRANAVVAKQR